nr:ribonuclease H-like domain-containing protein [Tanacetum cinerariifolium]
MMKFQQSLLSWPSQAQVQIMRGLSQVEARLVELKENEVKNYERIRVLERDVEIRDNKIKYLMNELDQVKKEKESLDNKLSGFENASKDLDNLLGSQRSDKNKEGLGYSAVPPPPAQIYSPSKKDLSWIGLPEFVDDTVTDYRRTTPSIAASKCNKSELQSSNFFVFKHGESTGSIMSKPMIKFVKEADCPRVIKINNTENARKSTVKHAEMETMPKDNYTHKSMTPRVVLLKPGTTPIVSISPMMEDMCHLDMEVEILLAEAFNTACYVQNRVLVNKSQNKTPYELFDSRIPAIGFLRPFGHHVMILNTLDHMGKFDAKGDEGYFVGYSLSSKAFRVFNKRTKKVEENLHVDFLENKLIEKGAGPNWLFNIDTLTNLINYVPVVVAETSSTNISGTKDVASKVVKKDVSSLRYIALPNWFHKAHMETSNDTIRNSDAQEDSQKEQDCNADIPECSGISNPTTTSKVPSADQVEHAVSLTVEYEILTISLPVPTVCLDISPKSSSGPRLISKGVF